MKIACIGAGPAGLYFAISMKLRDPSHGISVFERNPRGVTFGWGVVFSDLTVENITKQFTTGEGVVTAACVVTLPSAAAFISLAAVKTRRMKDYDVTPDGERFLAVVNVPVQDADAIAVTANWLSLLPR